MRTSLQRGGVRHLQLRHRTVATRLLGSFALLTTLLVTALAAVAALAATAAWAQTQPPVSGGAPSAATPGGPAHATAYQADGARTNTAQPTVNAALVEVPTGELSKSGLLGTVPVSDLGLSESELAKILAGLAGGALTGKEATLNGLVSGLLSEKPGASLEELVSKIKTNPVLGLLLTLAGKNLTTEEVLKALSPNEEALKALSPQALSTVLQDLTETATATKLQQLLADLAGSVPSGEEAAALHTIVEALTSSLPAEDLSKLRSDLAALPTGPSKGELETFSPAQLAAVVDGLFGSATPTQLAPVAGDLLSTLKLGTGTTQSLAEGLGVPVESLASALGEAGMEGFSSLPVNTGELASTGKVMGLVDRAKNLALGVLGTEGGEGNEEGNGGSGGSGSGGSGGEAGSGGSGSGNGGQGGSSGAGGSGSGGNGGSNPGGSGAGGSGGLGGSGSPSGGLTVTVTLPASPGASAAAGSRGAAKSTPAVQVLAHRVHGHTAELVLKAPAAGTLVLSGLGMHTVTRRVSKGGRVTLSTLLSRAGMASLQRAHHDLRVRLKVLFKPTKGSSSSATVTVTFA
jgi:hypothetical protein